MGYLTETAEAGGIDLMASVEALAQKGGPGPVRQAFDLVRLTLSRQGVRPEEYFTYALWRKDRGRAFLKGFLPNRRTRVFNTAFQMPARGIVTHILNDKARTEAILTAKGLPVTRTVAAYLPKPDPNLAGLTGLRPLRSAGEIADFLADPANLPVFGKPRSDSFARGAAMIGAKAGADQVRFLNGKTAPIADLAAEITADWAAGYLFQPFYQCETGLRRHVGAAMASIRIVTLQTERGVEPWYAVIRLPAKSAMHDGDALEARIWGLIDLASGQVVKLRSLRDPLAPDMTCGNDPEAEFLGFTLPDWDQALTLCRLGHEAFPGHGILGWDVFLTDQGPLLNEANVNPGHVYQVAAQRPLLNPEMRPAYDRAMAFASKHGGGQVRF
ncbi:MAG: hypothetical protein HC783_18090 [Rhodobacteraceae bacterium]|nr:hypothetical protein [Paracoccaceae bacterium]